MIQFISTKPLIFHGMMAIVCLFLVFFCLRWSFSDILITQVDYQLDINENSEAQYDLEALKKTKQKLDLCLSIRPESAHYYQSSERFYQLLDTLETNKPDLIKNEDWTNNINKAYQYAKLALQIRPTSGYLWKELLLSKVAMQEYDSEMSGAFERVYALGGWNEGLLYYIMRLGVDNWDHHNTSTKKTVVAAMERYMAFNEKKPADTKMLFNIIHAERVCPTIDNQQQKFPLMTGYCNTTELSTITN